MDIITPIISKTDKNRLGFVLGGFAGLMHVGWVVLVALGWAQPLVNFIFRMHFIMPTYQIMPFSLGRAVGLVALTTVIGYIVGNIIGAIWNRVHHF